MQEEYITRVEEGVTLSPYTLEFTAYLQSCYELMDNGKENMIFSDPFYERADSKQPITDDEVDKIIAVIDLEFEYELGTYPGYHRNRSGANALPEFNRLGPVARRAMVEGIDRIAEKYKISSPPLAVPNNNYNNDWC